MTWFDGHPAHLWEYPPTEEGVRYVECMGGVDSVCEKAEQYIEKGDSRFAATLLAHVTAGYPDSERSSRAKVLLANAYEKIGFGCENATWRNLYLTGAQELRTGKNAGMVAGGRTPLGPNLSVDQWFDVMSVQLDGERAAEARFSLEFEITDLKQTWQLIVSNGVLTRRLIQDQSAKAKADFRMVLTRMQLLAVLRGDNVDVESKSGSKEVLEELLDYITVRQGSSRGPSQL